MPPEHRLNPGPVVHRRDEHPRHSHHGLTDERRDVVRPDAIDRRFELVDQEVGRIPSVEQVRSVRPRRRQVVNIREQRPEALAVDVEAGR